MWWKVDMMKMAVQLLPPVMRGGLTVALLKVLTLPVRHIYEQLTARRKNADRRLNTTANVMYIEKALNEAFYLKERQIWIESTEAEDVVFWHRRDEMQKDLYMYRRTEKSATLKRIALWCGYRRSSAHRRIRRRTNTAAGTCER